MDAAERIPNTVERVIVRLVALPQRILARVVLRRERGAVNTRPEDSLQALIDAAGLDRDNTKSIGPCLSRCRVHGVEVKVWNLAFRIRASLVHRDEADSNTSHDFGRCVEARPRSCGKNLGRVVHAVLDDGKIFWLVASAIVHEDASVADLSSVKVGAEMESI